MYFDNNLYLLHTNKIEELSVEDFETLIFSRGPANMAVGRLYVAVFLLLNHGNSAVFSQDIDDDSIALTLPVNMGSM